MGLGPAAVKLNLELWQRGLFREVKSVGEIGSQELHLPLADFEALVRAAGLPLARRERFSNLSNWPRHPRCSSKPFYELLGAERYTSFDLNRELGALPLDLNRPLEDRSLYGQFDLVTDYGCNEHAFNIGEAYRTMHRLCKPQGLMVILQAVYGGNGYYQFDLPFFEGLAAANRYAVLFSSYIISTKDERGDARQFHIPLSRELLRALDWSKVTEIGISYVFQRQADADFEYPYQGSYLSERQQHDGYQLQFLPAPPSPSHTYLPVRGPTVEDTRTAHLVRTVCRRAIKKAKGLVRV